MLTIFKKISDLGAVQWNANLVDLENPEKMRLLSLSEASTQKRTSPSNFGDLAAKICKVGVKYGTVFNTLASERKKGLEGNIFNGKWRKRRIRGPVGPPGLRFSLFF